MLNLQKCRNCHPESQSHQCFLQRPFPIPQLSLQHRLAAGLEACGNEGLSVILSPGFQVRENPELSCPASEPCSILLCNHIEPNHSCFKDPNTRRWLNPCNNSCITSLQAMEVGGRAAALHTQGLQSCRLPSTEESRSMGSQVEKSSTVMK